MGLSEGETKLENRVDRAARDREAVLDAQTRRERGVVHTPPALARHAVAAADDALRAIGRTGLGDPDVVVLDPACGPGVFLAAALDRMDGARAAIGLDVDRDAISIARGILAPAFAARSIPLDLIETDTLASLELPHRDMRGATLAIIGNPPWAARTANRDARLTSALLDDFRREPDGVTPLRERKAGVLSDDYVRFWRWACEMARRAQGAVVALVTNASYLDGPVHRGMRAAMMRWFDAIDVVDLGGSALVARSGERDENVFGVRPAVALAVASRRADHDERGTARVRYARLRGSAKSKLDCVTSAPFASLSPAPPLLRWAPSVALAAYDAWPSLVELIPFHREGVQTNRDALCIDVDRETLLDRLRAFAAGGESSPGSAHYDREAARVSIADALDCDSIEWLRPIEYRPFDRRWLAAHPSICHRPRPELQSAIDRSELSLITVRKDRGEREWAHFGATRCAVDNCFTSSRSSCRARVFPECTPEGAPNVGDIDLFADALGAPPSASELLRYALCVLASSVYRERFDAALRADYPRLPPPPSEAAFRAALDAGDALVHAFCDDADREAMAEIGHHHVRAPRSLAIALVLARDASRALF